MSNKKYRKLWGVLGITAILYALVIYFYPSSMELSCDRDRGMCTYTERNMYDKIMNTFSFPIQGSNIVLSQQHHHYYTGRRVKKKTTVDYQLEVRTSEVEFPIFKASYTRQSDVLEQWQQFQKNANQRYLVIKYGFSGWIIGMLILLSILMGEVILFHFLKYKK